MLEHDFEVAAAIARHSTVLAATDISGGFGLTTGGGDERHMAISKLKIFYILSLVALIVLLVFAVFRPMVAGPKYSEVQRTNIIKSSEGWIMQFNLINREGSEQHYTIFVSVDNKEPYRENVLLGDDRTFIFVRRIPAHELVGDRGKVTLSIYKEDETEPFEETTYYLE
ncbi:MAG: hypothetical protein ABH839_01440 [Chloroflexota bacterium]